MCGIAGIWAKSGQVSDCNNRLSIMIRRLNHRGPDGNNRWIDRNGRGGLGFCRLAIIDLSDNGMQPLWNEDKNVGIVFNGEFYGYKKWRRTLIKNRHKFRSESDAEVALHLYEEFGLDFFLKEITGMFALAIWDKRNGEKLILVRDRLGEKPLYVYETPTQIVFASELKAIESDPFFVAALDCEFVAPFLMWAHIPAPLTPFKNVIKLPPAHCMVVSDKQCDMFCYWNLDYRNKSKLSINDQEEIFDDAIREAIKLRTVADVPISLFLSGGIDSTVIAKILSENGISVESICAAFDGDRYNESNYARAAAKTYGLPFKEVSVQDRAINDLEKYFDIIDEPFADEALLPLRNISEIIAKQFRVVLSGDGGDELLAGYHTKLGKARQLFFSRFPWKSRHHACQFFLDNSYGFEKWQERIRRGILPEIATMLSDSYFTPYIFRLYAKEAKTLERQAFGHIQDKVAYHKGRTNSFEDFILSYRVEYMSHCFLTKTDLATMSCSLENRAPFLDHRLMEMMAAAPVRLKLFQGINKLPFRRLLNDDFSERFVYRHKHGFSVPIGHWLRNDFREIAECLLLKQSRFLPEIFNMRYVRQMFNEHVCGAADHTHRLWLLLVLEVYVRQHIFHEHVF